MRTIGISVGIASLLMFVAGMRDVHHAITSFHLLDIQPSAPSR
jgi:hypothetical protein